VKVIQNASAVGAFCCFIDMEIVENRVDCRLSLLLTEMRFALCYIKRERRVRFVNEGVVSLLFLVGPVVIDGNGWSWKREPEWIGECETKRMDRITSKGRVCFRQNSIQIKGMVDRV